MGAGIMAEAEDTFMTTPLFRSTIAGITISHIFVTDMMLALIIAEKNFFLKQ